MFHLRCNWRVAIRCWLLAIAPLIGGLGLSSVALAQEPSGALSGSVVDSEGAVMPHTVLTLSNDSTGLERQVNSDINGRFAFPLLPPGTYTLMANVNGFSQVRLTSLQVNAGIDATVQVQFPPLTFRSSGVEVNLVFIAMNRWGHFVGDLQQSDLQILDNGEPPARVTHFENRTDLPLDVALVIDTSDSIRPQFKTQLSAGIMFLKATMNVKQDQAMVVGFNQNVLMAQAPSNDLKLLADGIHRLHLGGTTALFDAVSFAAKKLGELPEDHLSRRVVVLISDGDDNDSHINFEQTVQAAQRAGVIIFALDTNNDGLGQEEDGDKVMRRLAEATGGRLLPAKTDEQLRSAFMDIHDAIRHQYVIGYSPSLRAAADGNFHRVKLVGPKGLHIHCREGYYVNASSPEGQ